MKTKERLSFTSQASFLSRIAGLSGVKKNVVANYGGQLFGSLLGFILVPVYISYIGIEGYGLVGFFAFLTTVVTVLDLGLTPVVQYETARLAALPGEEQRLRDLLRTLEYIYGVIGIAIGLCIVLSSSWIAQYWVRPVQLSDEDVEQSIMLMGICLACRWPFSLYGGGLIGLQRQGYTQLDIRARGYCSCCRFSSHPVAHITHHSSILALASLHRSFSYRVVRIVPGKGASQGSTKRNIQD